MLVFSGTDNALDTGLVASRVKPVERRAADALVGNAVVGRCGVHWSRAGPMHAGQRQGSGDYDAEQVSVKM